MTRQQQQHIALLLRRAERTLAALADLASLVQLRADNDATVAARIQAALEDIRAVLEMVDTTKQESHPPG
jgi:hypothetical protein